jgi:hypothetical protein
MTTDEARSKRGYLSNKRHVTSQNTIPLEQTETGSEKRVCVTINGGKDVENDDRETHGRERGQTDWKGKKESRKQKKAREGEMK